MADNRRRSDGVTVNKVMVTMTGSVLSVCLMLVSFIYLSDRKETGNHLSIIAKQVSIMASNITSLSNAQLIYGERSINMDARIIENKESIEMWREEVRQYWASK